MARIHVSASALVGATPQAVFAILADYHHGHRAILPKRSFSDLQVERGGLGGGTAIRYKLRLLGITREVRAEISESEAGRVLVETDPASGAVTTFTVDPEDGGRRSRVTITTRWTTPGLSGWVQRLLAPRRLRRLYDEELRNLADYAVRPRI